tara:strand:- start:405 stop:1106 length:702 start_codon:yes stop_codon:yes gene_type:complete
MKQNQKITLKNNTITSIGKSSEGFQYVKYFVKSEKNIKSFLDIGCGNGNLINLMNQNKIKYLGVDADAGIYKKTKNKFIKYFKDGYTTEKFLKKHQKKYDCVVLMDVLEHTDKFDELFKIALKKSNKYVMVGLPNEEYLLNRLRFLVGQGIPTHGLDMVGTKPGHKHQWLIQYDKSLSILSKCAKHFNFKLHRKYFFITLPNNFIKRIIYILITFLMTNKLKMGNFCFIFKKI